MAWCASKAVGWEMDHKSLWYLRELICVDWHTQSRFPHEFLGHILLRASAGCTRDSHTPVTVTVTTVTPATLQSPPAPSSPAVPPQSRGSPAGAEEELMCASLTALPAAGQRCPAVPRQHLQDAQQVQTGVKCQGRDCCAQGCCNGVWEHTESKGN